MTNKFTLSKNRSLHHFATQIQDNYNFQQSIKAPIHSLTFLDHIFIAIFTLYKYSSIEIMKTVQYQRIPIVKVTVSGDLSQNDLRVINYRSR